METKTPCVRKPGRPPAEIDLDRLRELASLGLTAEHIADRLGIARRTLLAKAAADPTVKEALDAGYAAALEKAALGLQGLIDEKNVAAIIFYLKAKGGWRTNEVIAPVINVNVGGEPAPIEIELVDDLIARQRALIEGRSG